MDLAHAGDLGGLFGDAADILAGDQQMDLAQLGRGGDGGQGGVLQLAAFMFDPDERLHAKAPVSLIFAISSSTEPTLIPACRLGRSEEHTSELQSLMRISYAVFCLKKKKNNQEH